MQTPTPSDAIRALNDLAARVGAVIANSPAADLERNTRAQFIAQLAKQGLVTREEFDIQRLLLERAQAKLRELDSKIAALEAERR